jgi:hypothetical protein
MTHGEVNNFVRVSGGKFHKSHIELEMKCFPGDSGGAVVSSEGGRLIGILSTGIQGEFLSTCTAWYDVLDLIVRYCHEW